MIQRLVKEDTATFDASTKRITFTFEAVPVSLVWTGNIAFSVGLGLGPDLQGIVWTAYRNGFPFVTWQEFGIACDVQAVGAEVLTVVGTYMGSSATLPLFEIKATWTGYSCDDVESTPAAPWVAGSNRGLVQVYNQGGADMPLEVVAEPFPPNVQRGRRFLAGAGLSGDVMTAVAATSFRIWEIGLAVSAGQLAATAGALFCTCTVQIKGTATPLVQHQISTVPGACDSTYVRLPLHGYTLPAGDTLQATTGAYGGDNLACVATAVYDTA